MKCKLFSLILMGVVFVNTAIAEVVFNGVVRDAETGKPIENAKIKYKLNSVEEYLFATVSDKSGKFQLEHKISYNMIFDVLAELEGYQSKKIEIIFNKSETLPSFEIELEKKPVQFERILKLKYITANEIRKHIYQELQNDVHMSMRAGNMVVFGTEDKVAKAEEIVQRIDQPPKQIMVQVMLLVANRGDRKEVEHHPKLKDIVKKLTSLFNYNYYWVIGESEMIGTEGEPFSVMSEGQQSSFAMDAILEIQDDVVQLKRMKVTVAKPTRAEISTTVNIKNGDTVILGASSGQHEGEAMITVVTAKIL